MGILPCVTVTVRMCGGNKEVTTLEVVMITDGTGETRTFVALMWRVYCRFMRTIGVSIVVTSLGVS